MVKPVGDLIKKIKKYISSFSEKDEELLRKAYNYSKEQHKGQKRKNGDPFFTHPLSVAFMLADYQFDVHTICAALMHDVLEDTEATFEQIEKEFTPEIAKLVEGLTKLARLKVTSVKISQIESYRKLVLAMSSDIRVLIIKLFDRLHNMRTLHFIKKPEKRHRIAFETLEVYLPLVERVGLDDIKAELGDLCIKELYPQMYKSINNDLKKMKKSGGDIVVKIIEQLKDLIEKNGIEADLYGREKKLYSVWSKMVKKQRHFDEICDIIAFRFIANSVEDCYKILGIIHSQYRMMPQRFKDFISTPKPNRYQSLHTTVIGPYKHRVEIQIRTKEMDEIAQYGVAAHWQYKQGDKVSFEDKSYFTWLRDMVKNLGDSKTPEEVEQNTKLSMFHDSVFCFSPKGDLVVLPSGSTILDFAYAIHSDIGNHCIGAKVNMVIKNIRSEINTCDQIEILTSNKQTPSTEWMRFVHTPRAKYAIKKYLTSKKRKELLTLGKKLLTICFDENNKKYNEKKIIPLIKEFHYDDIEDLYIHISNGDLTPEKVFFTLHPDLKPSENQKTRTLEDKKADPKKYYDVLKSKKEVESKTKDNAKKVYSLKGSLTGIPISFAKCCSPVPYDKIVGVIHTGSGITIHSSDCQHLEKHITDGKKVMDLAWKKNVPVNDFFIGKIIVLSDYVPGALNSITGVIAQENARISDLRILNKTEVFIEFVFDIQVKDGEQLDKIVQNIRKLKVVNYVNRHKKTT